MRIRTIKPEFWANEDIAKMDDFTKLLAIGLLNYADDEGYFNANPALIRAAIFPLRDESGSIPVSITTLEQAKYLELYKADGGRTYGRIVNFLSHQVINKPKASKIKPLCPAKVNDGTPTVQLPDASGQEQGTGNREQGTKEVEEERAALLLEAQKQPAPEPHWSVAFGWTGITDTQMGRWKIAYPACNIDRQLAQMDAWLRANPKEAKKKDWHRFAANWLKREQDKGGDVRADRRVVAPVASNPVDALAQNQPIRIGFTR